MSDRRDETPDHDQDISTWRLIRFLFKAVYWCFFVVGCLCMGLCRECGLGIINFRPQVYLQQFVQYLIGLHWEWKVRTAFRRNGSQNLCWTCQQFAKSLSADDFSIGKSEKLEPRTWTSRPLKQLHRTAEYCSMCRLVRKIEDSSISDYVDRGDFVATLSFETYDKLQIDRRLNVADFEHSASYKPEFNSVRIRIGFKDFQSPNRKLPADHQLILLADDAPFSFTYGRRINTGQIDIAQVKAWIRCCESSHSDVCSAQNRFLGEAGRTLPLKMHFIDVLEKRLVVFAKRSIIRYAALSYVWGPTEYNFMCKKSNFEGLCAPGGLVSVMDQIPQTVKDAMALVQSLGERYLWVDAICITQHDDKYRNDAIGAMDVVYSNAFVAIVAASGIDSRSGLPGVKLGSRSVTQEILAIRPSLRLVLFDEKQTDDLVSKTVYQTRAWTFQERLMSRRSLIFVNGRVYFECRRMCCREDEITEAPGFIDGRSHMGQVPSKIFEEQRFISLISSFIQDYSSRKLTKQSDVLNAFAAASRVLETKLNTKLNYGIFESHFEWGLLWSAAGELIRRPEFPSWSWTGWNVPVSYVLRSGVMIQPEEYKNWFSTSTWIDWYCLDPEGQLRQIRNMAYPTHEEQRLLPVLQQGLKTIMTRVRTGFPVLAQVVDQVRGSLLEKSALPKYPTKHQSFLAEHDVQREKYTIQNYGYPYLFFWTYTLHLRLTLQPSRRMLPHDAERDPVHNTGLIGTGNCRLGLADSSGTWRGSVVVHDSWQQRAGEVHEFILLSKSMAWDNEEFDLSGGRGTLGMFLRDLGSKNADKWFVMLVVWNGDVAERAGIGKIESDALSASIAPGLQWKEVILG